MADSDKVAQLCQVTNASAAEAQALLAKAGGNMERAVNLYFSGGAAGAGASASAASAADLDDDEDDGAIPVAQPNPDFQVPAASSAARGGAAASERRTGMHTFASLNSSDDPAKKSNELYAGGERSGIAVQGRDGQGMPSAEDLRKQFFEQAKKLGMSLDQYQQEVDREEKQSRTFAGQGFKLGETADAPAEVVGRPLQEELAKRPKMRKIKVTFWKGGNFSIDDGETNPVLRRADDPTNATFLAHMTMGRVPPELQKYGEDIDVEVEDRHDEDFQPPPRRIATFAGSGHRLGAVAPATDTGGAAAAAAAPGTNANAASAAPASAPPPQVDESKPTTKLQLRLADGTRLTGIFNHDATIADLRAFVDAARPPTGRSYVLMTSFPKKELTDLGQTLAQAGLLKGVVLQKYSA